jgi:hypothetical protein
MFINLNDLKGIIIDLDSFPKESDKLWVNVECTVKLLFFSAVDKERLSRIKSLDKRFKTFLGTPISVFTKKSIIVEMLNVLELHSYEVAFLSCEYENLTRIQELPISTIQFTQNDTIRYDEVGKLSDFQISSIDDLNNIIKKEFVGYFSEAASIIYGRGYRLEFQYGGIIVTEKDYLGHKYDVVSGGRYFNTNDVRNPYHQLSQRIIRNKHFETQQNDVFKDIYSNLTRFINDNIQQVDGITRVPPRPSENIDRFQSIVESICAQNPKYENCCLDLTCVKNYPSQKGLNELQRQINILGAFRIRNDLKGKHIVLIDDVISTGATAFEAAKTILQGGASRVTILVLAINQLTNNIRRHSFVPLYCDCGRELRMRFNRRNNSAFFGCTGYSEQACNATLDYYDGIVRHNKENEITYDTCQYEIDEWEF